MLIVRITRNKEAVTEDVRKDIKYLAQTALKYPMKRKHWEPGGGKKELRGKDEWVRISWDEALDLVAEELKRVKTKYGNESILRNK